MTDTYQSFENYRLQSLVERMGWFTMDKASGSWSDNRIREIVKKLCSQTEHLPDEHYQRDMSMRFEWGHNHDFGKGLVMEGRMGNRHIDIPSALISTHGIDQDLSGKTILDIGCWTGGAALLYSAMGAEMVYAVDEVGMYVTAAMYLADFWDRKIKTIQSSLYDLPTLSIKSMDVISMLGVLYHVSDPIVALRICFDMLKDGGQLWLETSAYDSSVKMLQYKGPSRTLAMAGHLRGGWTWFVPSTGALIQMLEDVGFVNIKMTFHGNSRSLVTAHRDKYKGMTRAGLNYR